MRQWFTRAVLGALAGSVMLAAPVAADSLIITPTGTAATLVTAFLAGGSGIVAGPATYTGNPLASGTFSTNPAGIPLTGIPFTDGILLTTGTAANAAAANTTDDRSATNLAGSDPTLVATFPLSTPQFDASVLEFSFTPIGSTVNFQYVFASEEYNEFVDDALFDRIGFFVNGVNVALVPSSVTPVSIASVNCVDNPTYYANNDPGFAPSSGTNNAGNAACTAAGKPANGFNIAYDGLAGGAGALSLFATAAVTKNVVNTIKIAITDVGRFRHWDSAVFLTAFSSPRDTTPEVPEPASLLMLGTGLALVARKLRRVRTA